METLVCFCVTARGSGDRILWHLSVFLASLPIIPSQSLSKGRRETLTRFTRESSILCALAVLINDLDVYEQYTCIFQGSTAYMCINVGTRSVRVFPLVILSLRADFHCTSHLLQLSSTSFPLLSLSLSTARKSAYGNPPLAKTIKLELTRISYYPFRD